MAKIGIGRAALFATFAVALGGGAKAAPPTAPAAKNAPAVQAVIDCKAIADDARRLACYDTAVAAMASAEQSGDLVSLDRQQRQQVRRQAFGFTLPSLSMFDVGEKGEGVNKIDEVVASASQDAYGKWTLRMQDGAVWRQIDDEMLSRRPKSGSNVVIQRGAIGSFMAIVDGQPGIRVHRDN